MARIFQTKMVLAVDGTCTHCGWESIGKRHFSSPGAIDAPHGFNFI